MSRAYDVPPERLGRWLDRWHDEHGPVAVTHVAPDRVTFAPAPGAGGPLVAEAPFPPLAPAGDRDGFDPGPLLAHAARDRVVGVLLVRLGGYAAGVFDGRELIAAKTGSRLVHGRHRAGGQSQRRFERRRVGQARLALDAAATVAARVLVDDAPALEAVVLGGDRSALDEVLADRRLAPLRPLVVPRVLADVPEPRRAVLETAPDRFRAVRLRPT